MSLTPFRDIVSTWEVPDLTDRSLPKDLAESNRRSREKERTRLLEAGFKQVSWGNGVDSYIKAPEGWSK